MKGAGEGSELTLENAIESEAVADDKLMDDLDPRMWEKIEGEAAKQKVIQGLRDRISKFHQSSPHFKSYPDNHLQDQKLEDMSREMDQAILDTIRVIEEEADTTFSRTPKAPGTTDRIVHEIKLREGEDLPRSPPQYRLSKPDRELIEEWIQWMLRNKLIRPSKARLVQNLLVMHKPGKEPRVCFDARAINRVTVPDGYPPHRMDTLFAKLRDCVVFTALDAASGFFQVEIKEEDRHKTAFRTESGVYEFCVMPFGLVNAPATFTRWMTESFTGLRDIMQVYMDDMIVHSKVLSEHHKHLRKVFRRCKEMGIKLRLSKCEFLKDELNLLGYVVSQTGIKKNLDKIRPILEYGKKAGRQARLYTVAQVRSFVGMCQWYRSFHHMFADHILVLSDLLKKGKSVKKDWGATHQIAFDSLKEIIAKQSLLYYPDEDKPFIIMTDASKFALGGALLQLQKVTDPEGNIVEEYRVVEFFSRSLIERERHYSVSEKEYLAIVSCVEKWKHYLHQHFRVITDHKPLLSMSRTDKARLQRWALRLTPFNFTLAWAPGDEMTLPDTLSRDPGLDSTVCLNCRIHPLHEKEKMALQTESDMLVISARYISAQELLEGKALPRNDLNLSEENQPLATVNLSPVGKRKISNAHMTYGGITVNLVMSRVVEDKGEERPLSIIHVSRLDNYQETTLQLLAEQLEDEKLPDIIHPGSPNFRQEQLLDPTLRTIFDKLEKKEVVKDYFIQEDSGLLMKVRRSGNPGVVVPTQSEENIFWLYHEHPLAGHASLEKMMTNINHTFFVRNLREKARKWVRHCQCMRAKARMRKKAGLTLSRPIPRLFAYLVIDLVVDFPRSRRGNIHWLTLVDAFSKDLELVPLKNKTAEGIAKAILEFWVCRRGCPVALLSDNAKEFTGSIAEALSKLLHLDKNTITAYQHTSAGLVERIHNYAHSIQRSANLGKLSEWDLNLPYIRFAILTHELDTSGASPFQITYGNKPTLPGDLTTQNHVLPKSMREYLDRVHKAMTHTRDYFKIQRQKTRIKNRLKRDELNRRFRKHYAVGEPVYVTRPSYTRRDGVKGLSKIVGAFRGPYEIVGTDNHNGIDVLIDGEEKHFNVGQTAEAYTLDPQDRAPPAYQDHRLVYHSAKQEAPSPEELPPPLGFNLPEIQQISDLDNPHREPESGNANPVTSQDSKSDLEENSPTQHVTGQLPTFTPEPNPDAKGDSLETASQQYQIVYDTVSGTYYAAQLEIDPESSQLQASLLTAAKKGQYHQIWYDPNDAEKVKSQKSRPKGYLPWVIPLDSTWERIGEVKSSLKQLTRRIITQQTLISS